VAPLPGPSGASLAADRFGRDICSAAERGELSIAFQPIVEFATGSTAGWEALARWSHGMVGAIPPRAFVGAADRLGCVEVIDTWVLNRACEWRAQRAGPGVIGVNVSAGSLDDPDFVTRMLDVVHSHAVDPSHLCVEVPETMAVHRGGVTERALRDLAEAGVWVALDDLCEGHATLEALSGLPVSVVKIDRSVAAGLGKGLGMEQYAATVAAICRLRDRRIVAEGIETPAQAGFFRDLGCTWGQGFYFGRPVSFDVLARIEGL
jgi:EAL domain-containing protein (putative c-di-GMP-specific phosphodiesterase class I)